MRNEYVTLVNRTSKTLSGTWDGKQHAIAPGRHAFPRFMAEKFRDQNPIMGSGNPGNANLYRITGDLSYLLGIVEDNDPIEAIEQSNAIEQWDRSKLPAGEQGVEIVPGKTGVFSGADVQAHLSSEPARYR